MFGTMELPRTILRPEAGGLSAPRSEVMRLLGYREGRTQVDERHLALVDRGIALARAAVAAGADGILVEVHQRPEEAKSDAAQTIGPAAFHQMMHEMAAIAQVLGRRVPMSSHAHVF